MKELLIGGRVPFSTVDMPGRTAAVLFCQGCPWRCRYCHNAHLRPQAQPGLAWGDHLRWLESRRGFLDAVVFSGGEPLVQPGLQEATVQVKAMGFDVGLHTGGCDPGALREVLPGLDWIGLDIKAPLSSYDRITGVPGSGQAAWEALALVLQSGVPHEIRTTCHPGLLSATELITLAGALARSGAKAWTLQAFRGQGCMDAALTADPEAALDGVLVQRLESLFLGEDPHLDHRPKAAPRLLGPATGVPRRQFLAR